MHTANYMNSGFFGPKGPVHNVDVSALYYGMSAQRVLTVLISSLGQG